MKKSKNFLIIIGIFLIGMLTGYENPEKIDRIKKIYKFYFQKKIILEKNISPICYQDHLDADYLKYLDTI